jgi:hypothetical protein
MGEEHSCATCENLMYYECPSAHVWCYENKDCPCNGDEVPCHDFICDQFTYDEDKDYMKD